MARWCNNNILDLGLEWLKNYVDTLCLCSSQPTTYEQATETYMLGTKGISSSDFTGPADDGRGGRSLTVKDIEDIEIEADGSLVYIAFVGTIGGTDTLMYVTTIKASTVLDGQYIRIPSFKINLDDPESF